MYSGVEHIRDRLVASNIVQFPALIPSDTKSYDIVLFVRGNSSGYGDTDDSNRSRSPVLGESVSMYEQVRHYDWVY